MMPRRNRRLLVPFLALALIAALAAAAQGRYASGPRFEVTVAKGLLVGPTDGRVLVVLAKRAVPEPRRSLGSSDPGAPPMLGADALAFAHGKTAVLAHEAAIFPVKSIGNVPPGEYVVQAVFDHNRDIRLHDAPGNLFSEPVKVRIEAPSDGSVQVIKLELTKKLPEETLPADTADVKYIKLKSAALSKFHGRDIYVRAGVILPAGHAKEPDRKYPLRVHIGGYGTRFTAVKGMMSPFSSFRKAWTADDAPRMILLHLDGAGPLGDPYQVDSANHGPYGEALTKELIPHVEKLYRGIGTGRSRVTDGASTGGWVSFALQVFYPDFFNGCWSHCPDPVDFRAFELMNIYRDGNAYVNARGFERSACRDVEGDTVYTMRHEVAHERVLGRGGEWTLSGKDWGAWNATFGPRGADGKPVPLWDKETGRIDRKVAAAYRAYDLRAHLTNNWAKLAEKLDGKIRIYVGEADDYFLNNAVHLLDESLQEARPRISYRIKYGARGTHSWQGIKEAEMLAEMGKATE